MKVYPISLLDVMQNFVGYNLTISGWGYSSTNGEQSLMLKAAFVTGLSNTACMTSGYGNSITKNMICAATNNFDADACQGDSGGLFF